MYRRSPFDLDARGYQVGGNRCFGQGKCNAGRFLILKVPARRLLCGRVGRPIQGNCFLVQPWWRNLRWISGHKDGLQLCPMESFCRVNELNVVEKYFQGKAWRALWKWRQHISSRLLHNIHGDAEYYAQQGVRCAKTEHLCRGLSFLGGYFSSNSSTFLGFENQETDPKTKSCGLHL